MEYKTYRAYALGKENAIFEGQLLVTKKSTYCFKGEEPASNICYFIYVETMGDWGLPNNHTFIEVDPITICENTEFKDKNSKPIFEYDTLKLYNHDTEYVVRKQDNMFVVESNDGHHFNLFEIFADSEIVKEGKGIH